MMSPEAMAARGAATEARKAGLDSKAQRESSVAAQAEMQEESLDEGEIALDNKAEAQEAYDDECIKYLVDNKLMSKAGKLLADEQRILDIKLDEDNFWINKTKLEALIAKVKEQNKPVKRDLYGQAGQRAAA